eukprot:8484706-Alexandrium_andersonii.AAC.1
MPRPRSNPSSTALLRRCQAASEAPTPRSSASWPETPAAAASVAALIASTSRPERGRSEGRTGRGRCWKTAPGGAPSEIATESTAW